MTERLMYLCRVRDALKTLVELDYDTDNTAGKLMTIEEAIEHEIDNISNTPIDQGSNT